MKINTLYFTVLCLVWLTLSCKEKRKLTARSSREIPESATQIADSRSQSSKGPKTTDSEYGELDRGGLPVDPELGMNSGKITKEQRFELHQAPPKGYHVGESIVARHVIGKADDIEWRAVGRGQFHSPDNVVLSRLLGLDSAQIPPVIRGAPRVLKSPSGGRVIVDMGGSALLFEARAGTVDVSSGKKLHCVNFDDKRRAFISWESFASESLILGQLIDDSDIDKLPSRQILYIYDIDKKLLRRVTFPKNVQEEGWKSFVIDSVARSAVLLRWDGQADLMTVYLDQARPSLGEDESDY